jgi:CubicO group peptidase (beta-lactamase class C family)
MSTIEVRRPAGRPVLAALFAAASLAGCVVPKPVPPPPPQPIVVAPVVRCEPPREAQDLAARHLLATEDRYSALNTADLAAEAAHPLDGASVEQQMDQALALSMTHSAGDLARAQGLLDQVLHNNSPQADPWRSLARLLAYRLGEQKRAEDAAERSTQQLRDAQRDNQRKLDDVNAKLEALKAIERSLNTRQAPAASAPKP